MVFEYQGFVVHRVSMRSYLVTGPGGFRGYLPSVTEAQHFIDGFIAGIQCEY
jgi:hypothetical protein